MNGHPDGGLLALYAGGELAIDKRHDVTAHLNSCPSCQNEVADLQNTRELLAQAFPEPGDLEVRTLHDSLISRLRHAPKPDGRIWLWAGSIITATAILTVMVSHKEIAPPTKIEEQTAAIQSLAPLPLRTTLDLPLRVPEPRRVRAGRPHRGAGIQGVSLLARSDGSSQLRLSTSDPNVVILVELNGATPNP